jgi:hypothetical protein
MDKGLYNDFRNIYYNLTYVNISIFMITFLKLLFISLIMIGSLVLLVNTFDFSGVICVIDISKFY